MTWFIVTAKPAASHVSIARWLISVKPNLYIAGALKDADALLAGKPCELFVNDALVDSGNEILNLVKKVYEDPYTAFFKEQQDYYQLCVRGAAGDAEAAIAYCKLEVEGKISHGPMG